MFFKEVVYSHSLPGGYGDGYHVAAPLLNDKAALHQLPLDPLLVRRVHVNLVNGYHNGNARGLGVVDGLYGLGHNAVVRGHHQHGDVRGLRAPGPHCSERLVAGGVQEGYLLAVVLHLVRPDVLRNAANLALREVALPYGVQRVVLPWSTWPSMVTTGGRMTWLAGSSSLVNWE